MVGFHCIDNRCILLVSSAELYAQLNVRTLHLMVYRLTNVMEQTGAFCNPDIKAQLCEGRRWRLIPAD